MDFKFHLQFGPVDTAVNTLLDRYWLVPEMGRHAQALTL